MEAQKLQIWENMSVKMTLPWGYPINLSKTHKVWQRLVESINVQSQFGHFPPPPPPPLPSVWVGLNHPHFHFYFQRSAQGDLDVNLNYKLMKFCHFVYISPRDVLAKILAAIRACATRDGTIFSKNIKFVHIIGASQNSCLRSVS